MNGHTTAGSLVAIYLFLVKMTHGLGCYYKDLMTKKIANSTFRRVLKWITRMRRNTKAIHLCVFLYRNVTRAFFDNYTNLEKC